MKRAFDLIATLLGLVVSAPLFVLIALLIKADDGPPIIFRQVRIGQRGCPFFIRKFRTMRASDGAALPLTVGDDVRITKVGRWLRKLKLDELPQLVNVLTGEMSLVGPRPEVPRYVERYAPDQRRVLEIVPGITDPATLRFWDESELLGRSSDPERTYVEEILPVKISAQLEYAARATLWTDLGVLVRTAGRLGPALGSVLVEHAVRYRSALILAVHIVLIVAGYRAAYELRFDLAVPPRESDLFWITVPTLLVLRLASYARFGLFRGYWQHFGLPDLINLGKAVSISSAVFAVALVVAGKLPGVPRSVLVLDWVAAIFLSGGVRFAARCLKEYYLPFARPSGPRALVVGTGDAAERLLRDARREGRDALHPVGLVTEDPVNRHRAIHDIPVVGTTVELPTLVVEHRIGLIVIALDAPRPEQLERVVDHCTRSGVEFKTLPSLHELLRGASRATQLRDVRLEDLLGRDSVRLDLTRIAADVEQRTVLITGGAGSIGSELGRQIARFRPRRLVLVDQAESALYLITRELREAHPSLDILPVIGNVTDQDAMRRLFASQRPEYVIHAAAYKHVPLMEDNLFEAVRNNVLGTLVIAQQAADWGTGKFVFISTDKAVNPSSVMGATKRIGERVVLGLGFLRQSATDFRAVRFGNVLGSNGSVVPIFEAQLAAGGPLTVTHPEVERYFMTIAEAAQLVLQAAALPEAAGRIVMLDMGRAMRILDLAERLIRLSGREPYRDVRIVFSGLRPGEKLREELMSVVEAAAPTSAEKVWVVAPREDDPASLERSIELLTAALAVGDADRLLAVIGSLVPECVPPLRDRPSGQHGRPQAEWDEHPQGETVPA